MTTKKIRRKGEGSVYQVGKSWTGKLQDGKKPDGKPNRLTFTGRTEAEVRRKIRQYHKDKEKYSPQNITSLSLKEYAENWLYSHRIYQLKESSFDRLESTMNNHIISNIGHLQLSNVESNDIQSLINDLFNQGLSHSSVKKVYDACNSLFRYATIRDLKINPMHGVTMISSKRFKKTEIKYFNKDEIATFEEEVMRKYKTGANVYKYGYAFILMLNTGMRESEILGLSRTKDIDLEANVIHVRNSVTRVKERDRNDLSVVKGYSVKVQDTVKTDAGNRIIPLNKKARHAVEQLLLRDEGNELLISNEKGQALSPSSLNKAFKRVIFAANLGEEGGTHILRHTFASMLFENGVDVKVVSELLGHASVSITYNTYIHLIKKQKVSAIQSLDF